MIRFVLLRKNIYNRLYIYFYNVDFCINVFFFAGEKDGLVDGLVRLDRWAPPQGIQRKMYPPQGIRGFRHRSSTHLYFKCINNRIKYKIIMRKN